MTNTRRWIGLGAGGVIAIMLLLCFYVTSSSTSTSKLEDCIALTISDADAYEFGEAAAYKQVPLIDRSVGLKCTGGLTLFFPQTREEISGKLIPKLITNPAFREGTYAGLGGISLSRSQRKKLGVLGRQLERNVISQLTAMKCEQASPEAVIFVSQLDSPFATAVIGTQLDVPDPIVAQKLGDILISKIHKMTDFIPEEACSEASKKKFTDYAEDMRTFSNAEHTWAPGCGVEVVSGELHLKCKGVTRQFKD